MRARIHGIVLALVMTTVAVAGAQRERNVPLGGALLPCCVVERQDAAGTFLVLKRATGELLRVTTPSTRYRVGQVADLNSTATALAITPFPVEYERASTVGGNSAWKMKTWIRVSTEGAIEGETRMQSAEPLRGFTGGVEVLLIDRSGNILHQTNLRTYGVGANSEKTSNWLETASLAAVNKVRAVLIHHSYEPTTRLAAQVAWINANAGDVSKVLTCIRQKAGAAIQCPE